MEVIKNQKGGQKVCFDGYMYNKHISKETYIRWRCTKHNSGCKGTLRTTSNIESPVVISEHNHQGDQRNVDVAKVRVDMKERASRPEGKPCQIIARSTVNVPLDSLALLPDNKTLKRTIQNEKARNFPVEPPLVNDLNLEEHEKFKKTKPDENGHAEDFLLYDNENRQGNRIICFASKTQLKQLADARIWYLDGNHKMSPRNFEQVYFIRTNLGENCSVLAISSFLQRKTEETYSELFRMLVDKCEQTFGYVPSPEIAMIDFEAAAKNALEGALDAQTEVKGCFYHLTQSTFRKLQALGLVALYKDDEEFRHFCGMLDGLAFLPSENVIEGMDILREVCPQEAEPLLDYFDKTYVNGTRRVVNIRNGNQIIRRTPPLFPIEMWNVHQATMIKDPRTNNIAEGGNNRYKELIGHHHPSIWRSIDALQFEEKSVCLTLVKYNIGEMPAVRVSRHTKRHQK